MTMGGSDPLQPAGVEGRPGAPGAAPPPAGPPGSADFVPAAAVAAPGDFWPGAGVPDAVPAADRELGPAAAPGAPAEADAPALGVAAEPDAGTAADAPASPVAAGVSAAGAADPGAAAGAGAPWFLPLRRALSLSEELRFPHAVVASTTAPATATRRIVREAINLLPGPASS